MKAAWLLAALLAVPSSVQAQAQAAPSAPAPPPPSDHAADRYYDPAAMAAARRALAQEHGGETYSMVMANILERQVRSGADGYRWEGQASVGGDLDRLVIKTEGEGDDRRGVAAAEVQGLYSRAVGPYFNLQAGVRQDLRPTPMRTYATLGVEGLAPYWLEVEAALFLSTRGEVLARGEATYDLRLTQRLILQPRVEVNLAAQDVRATGVGSGLSNAELGLRLRYAATRTFAPYLGVSYDRRFGRTATFARQVGDGRAETSFVAGIRTWF
jgi:copper resistance protein B